MKSYLKKFFGLDTRDALQRIEKIEYKKREQDTQLRLLVKATMDGEEGWFMTMVRERFKKDPECSGAILDNCLKVGDRR